MKIIHSYFKAIGAVRPCFYLKLIGLLSKLVKLIGGAEGLCGRRCAREEDVREIRKKLDGIAR